MSNSFEFRVPTHEISRREWLASRVHRPTTRRSGPSTIALRARRVRELSVVLRSAKPGAGPQPLVAPSGQVVWTQTRR